MTTAIADRLGLIVHGTPIPQGSKKIARRGHGSFLVDTNDKTLKSWRTTIALHAADTFRYHDDLPHTAALRVWLWFTFTRPTSHYRTGRNAALLRASAPAYPGHSCGDIDKLVRAVLDALTTPKDRAWPGVWADDTQVVDLRARKFYAGEDEHALDRPGLSVVVEPLTTGGRP